MIHHTLGGGDQMMISVWRHQKDQSGILLDVGVHFADMMEYFLGPITTVYAQTRLHEPIRHNPVAEGKEPTANPAGVYGRWQKAMPARFPGDGGRCGLRHSAVRQRCGRPVYRGPRSAWAGSVVAPDSRLQRLDGYAQ